MELWSALILGVLGSLHCAGMCGPLALALPSVGRTPASFVAGRLAYNAGRVITYGLLGAFFGLIGGTLAVAGLQRWLSIAAGAAILIGLLLSSRFALALPAINTVGWLKSAFGKLLQQRTLSSLLFLGGLNGLLPCGLVYVACAGATATGNLQTGVMYMLVFGLGTVPMMLGIGLFGQKLQIWFRFRLEKLVPACLTLVAVLLILRGLSLGIPYVSPDLPAQPGEACSCH